MISRRFLRKWVLPGALQAFLLLSSLFILAPLAIMFLGSFKGTKEAAQLSLSLPTVWHPENYQVVYEKGRVGRAFLNSALITISAVFVTLLTSSMASFYLARAATRLSKRIYNIFMIGLVAPISLIPTIKLLQILRLNNSYLGVILVFSALNLSFSVLLMTGFVKTIPRQLDEAALIDGCGALRTFFQVVLPLLIPVIATGTVFIFMGVWNSFVIPLYFLSDSDKWPMPLTVYNFFGQYQSSWNLVFADLVMTASPVLIVYILAQRYIIEGMTAGAIKG